jgi:hypothetical protein
VLFSFPLWFPLLFGVKPLSQLSTLSIGCLHLFLHIAPITSGCLAHCTPQERLFGSSPTYHQLRVFGSACFVLLQPHKCTKLEPRSRLCCFLGYGVEQKGYRCYDLVSHCLRISRHVVFWEHKLFHEVGKFSMPFFPPFTALLEMTLSLILPLVMFVLSLPCLNCNLLLFMMSLRLSPQILFNPRLPLILPTTCSSLIHSGKVSSIPSPGFSLLSCLSFFT